jgi:hypothetical protein
MKQTNKTAVEWLEEQIRWRTDITDIIKKAKEMEKQQILRAAYHGTNYESSPYKDAEDYYNKTFKSK